MNSVIQENARKENMTSGMKDVRKKMRNVLGSENDEVYKNQNKKK